MALSNIKPALLIFDSAFSSDGILVPPEGYVKKAAEIVREAGGVYIADEVQAGFWRSGDNMWGFQGIFKFFVKSQFFCAFFSWKG
jgi:4-aminobutyrate aminotransferase-like enzyme